MSEKCSIRQGFGKRVRSTVYAALSTTYGEYVLRLPVCVNNLFGDPEIYFAFLWFANLQYSLRKILYGRQFVRLVNVRFNTMPCKPL